MGFSCAENGRWEEGNVGLRRRDFRLHEIWVWAIKGSRDVYRVVGGQGGVAKRSDDGGDFGVQ